MIRFENIFAKVSVELLSDTPSPRKGDEQSSTLPPSEKGRRRAEFRVTGFLCVL